MNNVLTELKEIVLNGLKENLPNVKMEELEENGMIYYMNGKNGTEFDFHVNGKLSSFMCFYDDKANMGAVKAEIYESGELCLYYFENGADQATVNYSTYMKAREKDILKLAVILNKNADNKDMWDDSIERIASDEEVSKEEIEEFKKSKENFLFLIEERERQNILMQKTAVISKKVVDEGWKIGYMYKEEPTNEEDSGWVFMAGNEDDEFAQNGQNYYLIKLGEVVNLDFGVYEYLSRSAGTYLIRVDSDRFEDDGEGKEIFCEKYK